MRRIFLLFLLISASSGYAQARANAKDYPHFFSHHQCTQAAFNLAVKGYNILLKDGLISAPRYLTIIDYSKRSNQHRLFVLDMNRKKLNLASIVAHGVGSDPDSTTIPYRFSNRNGSRMSSIGFYLTGDPYTNHRPSDSLGLCLFGLDKFFNDSAAAREIVLHYGATEHKGTVYVTDSGAARSYGCPALPLSANTRVINLIRGGSLLFIYSAKEPQYPKRSTVLNNAIHLPIVQQGPPPNNCSCSLTGNGKDR